MRFLPCLLAALAALSLGSPSRVGAQPEAPFSTVRFRPAVGPGSYLGVEGAQTGPAASQTFALSVDYAADSLVVAHPCRRLVTSAPCDDERTVFLAHTTLVHLAYARALGDRTLLSASLPLGGTSSDAAPFAYTVGPAYHTLELRDGFVLGDLRLAAKVRVLGTDRSPLRVAAAASLTLPTGLATSHGDCRDPEHCSFVSERGVQAGGAGIVELAPYGSPLRVAGTLGLLYRPARTFLGDTEVGSELTFAAAAAYRIIPQLFAKVELAGALELAGADDLPLEARAGLTYGRDLAVTVGGGAGIVGDVGSPTYRLFAGVAYRPVRRDSDGDGRDDATDRCRYVAEDRDGYRDDDGCPDLDNDDDHRPDDVDQCDDQPEDLDGFEDHDGCPDPDNDGDGVLDGYDTCEGAREDHDGDHDDDGCPDLDGDRDGVDDSADKCPNEPEDTDGLGDEDGCPELDHDGDGLADTDDACPEAAGPKSGPRGREGCPR